MYVSQSMYYDARAPPTQQTRRRRTGDITNLASGGPVRMRQRARFVSRRRRRGRPDHPVGKKVDVGARIATRRHGRTWDYDDGKAGEPRFGLGRRDYARNGSDGTWNDSDGNPLTKTSTCSSSSGSSSGDATTGWTDPTPESSLGCVAYTSITAAAPLEVTTATMLNLGHESGNEHGVFVILLHTRPATAAIRRRRRRRRYFRRRVRSIRLSVVVDGVGLQRCTIRGSMSAQGISTRPQRSRNIRCARGRGNRVDRLPFLNEARHDLDHPRWCFEYRRV